VRRPATTAVVTAPERHRVTVQPKLTTRHWMRSSTVLGAPDPCESPAIQIYSYALMRPPQLATFTMAWEARRFGVVALTALRRSTVPIA
jgi:hypothetical protein